MFWGTWSFHIDHALLERSPWYDFTKFHKISLISAYANLLIWSHHFWKQIFSAIKHNSSVLFFSSKVIYFDQRSQLKRKFFWFLRARVKIRQIPQVNFEITSQLIFRFCIILHCYDTYLAKFLWKRAKFLMPFSKAQVSFYSNFASIFRVSWKILLCTFLAQTLYTLVTRSPWKSKLFRLSSAWVKIRQIPHVNFKMISQFLFNFCVILHCHDI